MPEGVEVLVEDGFATIEFPDRSKRGVALAQLFEHAPADEVRKVTYPRPGYVVPEQYARAAGLLDGEVPSAPERTPDPIEPNGDYTNGGGDPEPVTQTWPDGDPSEEWRRDELDDYALNVKKLDTSSKTDFPHKADVVKAIQNAEAK